MSLLSNYINAQVHKPAVAVKVGGSWQPYVISCEWDRSFDQTSTSCTIVFGAKLTFVPNNTTQVVVYEGYSDQVVPVFTGYVDEYRAGAFPNTWEMRCRDVLKRAEDIWLDDEGVSYTSTQAETAVADLLSKAGITVSAGTTNFTIGDIHPVKFKMVSIMDACNQIAALIGWRIWCSADGTVYFRKRKPHQLSSPEWTYTYGTNILKRNYYKTDRDLRNRIVVLGYWDPDSASPIRAVHYASSPYTDAYRTAILSSELIDTQSMADTIATWMLQDLNSLTYVYEFECPGNPLIDVGRTIRISDASEGVAANFFVYSINARLDGNTGEFRYRVTAVRWDTSNENYIEPNPTPVPPPPPPPPPPSPPTPTPGPVPQGKGNLLYVTTLRGLAKCTGAYGTNGTDGNPVWENLSCNVVSGGSTLVSQNGVSLFNDGTINWTTAVSVGDRIVSTDQTIDGVVVAIVDATELTLDNSRYVSNKTFTMYRLKPGLQSADAVKIRWFNLDTFSSLNNGTFSAGWAMTDDGLYRVTGLPNNPTWTRQLTRAQAASMLGKTESQVYLTYQFTPSALKENFIVLMAGYYDHTYMQVVWYFHPIWSLDGGSTWNTDVSKYIVTFENQAANFQILASNKFANRVYIAGKVGMVYNYPDPSPPLFSARATIDGTSLTLVGDTSFTTGYGGWTYIYFPFSDANGNMYPDDQRAYTFGTEWAEDGANGLRRFSSYGNPLWSPNYTPPPYENVGGSGMGRSGYSGRTPPFWLFTNMFNEDYGVAVGSGIDGVSIWFTTNLTAASPTWTRHTSPIMIGGRQSMPKYMFCVPAEKNLVFFTGATQPGSGCAQVYFTPDFGTTFVDISGYGYSNGIDKVMGLTSTDQMDYSTIFVDYNYVGESNVSPSAGIDVSHYQGTMNWATAKNAGVEFAFIKATEGTTYTDPTFSTNWSGAGAQGIKRGPYHYFINNVDPVAQADHFYAVAASGGELGYAVDCEDESASLDPSNLKAFLDRMETLTGQKCIIYTRASWWNKYVGSQSWTSNYPLWVAHWGASSPTLPIGWTTYRYWQYSNSGTGSVYGASSATIDLDQAKGTV